MADKTNYAAEIASVESRIRAINGGIEVFQKCVDKLQTELEVLQAAEKQERTVISEIDAIQDCIDEFPMGMDDLFTGPDDFLTEVDELQTYLAAEKQKKERKAWSDFAYKIMCDIDKYDGKVTFTAQEGSEIPFHSVETFDNHKLILQVERTDDDKFAIFVGFGLYAVYETPLQVADVLYKLIEDVKAGKEKFTFPTQKEYNRAEKAEIYALANKIAGNKKTLINGRDWEKASPAVREIIAGIIDNGIDSFTIGDYLEYDA